MKDRATEPTGEVPEADAVEQEAVIKDPGPFAEADRQVIPALKPDLEAGDEGDLVEQEIPLPDPDDEEEYPRQ